MGPLGEVNRAPSVMPDAPKADKIFNSTFPMKVDEKRRVQIPAKWRPDEPGAELTLVPWETAHGMSLRVFPQGQFLKMIEKIESMAEGSVERDELLRKVGRNSEQVTIDSAGRITLPDGMLKAAGLSTQAVLVGVVRVFEIWSPERFAASEASTALGAANYRFIG
jgi:MraZ protein